MNDKIFFCFPSIRRGNGTGHLVRCAGLAGRLSRAWLWLPQAGKNGFFSLDELAPILAGRNLEKKIITAETFSQARLEALNRMGGGPADDSAPVCVVLDQRETSREDLSRFPPGCLFLGLDEGGPFREKLHYLIDILPGGSTTAGANLKSTAFLDLPRNRRRDPAAGRIQFAKTVKKVLISFGMEDPAGLGRLVTRKITAPAGGKSLSRFPDAPEFDFISSVPEGGSASPIRGLPLLPDLKNRLADYDLLISSFGITALEALSAGVYVILVNPGRYHETLSRKTGLPSLGVKRFSVKKFLRLIEPSGDLPARLLPQKLENLKDELAGPEKDLSAYLENLRLEVPVCPRCCGRTGSPDKLLARFSWRTWYQCRRCGLVYQNLHRAVGIDYGREYFFEDYEKQYGKTYLEDFPHLRELAAARLDIIADIYRKGAGRKAAGRQEKTALDLGCAYGAFLLEARERGWTVMGSDISSQAADYVREELGIPALAVSAEELDLNRDFHRTKVELIVLWYVIEHFPRLNDLLAKFSSWQEKGGIFAFSTPNYGGISGRFRRNRFLEESPEDHYQIWSPKSARTIMAFYGYRIKKIRITGHHPERFPRASGLEAGSLAWRFLRLLSRIFRLGDTFEVYCEKTGDD